MHSILLVSGSEAVAGKEGESKEKLESYDHKLIRQDKGYVWPDQGTIITDSNKTNVTVQFGKLGYSSKAKTTFEYWIRQKMNNETKGSFYEFHYRCYFENMDPRNWKKDGSDVLECNFGFHQYQTVLDWSLIRMPYKPSHDTNEWKCIDGYQQYDHHLNSYAGEISVDQEQNCNYIDPKNCKVFVQGKKEAIQNARRRLEHEGGQAHGQQNSNDQPAGDSQPSSGTAQGILANYPKDKKTNWPIEEGLLSFVVHNWRPVNPYDLTEPPEDYWLKPGEQMSFQIQFKYPEEERNTGICLQIPTTVQGARRGHGTAVSLLVGTVLIIFSLIF